MLLIMLLALGRNYDIVHWLFAVIMLWACYGILLLSGPEGCARRGCRIRSPGGDTTLQ